MTIKEYIKLVVANGHMPFIKESWLNTEDEYVSTEEFQTNLTDYMKFKYGGLIINPDFTDDDLETMAGDIKSMCTMLYKTDSYRYNTLHNTMVQTYNPIENYRMVEASSETTSDSVTESKTVGSQSNSRSYGQTNKSTVHGAQSTSNAHGAQDNVVTHSGEDKTLTHGAQSDSMVYGATSKTITNGAGTDTKQYVDSMGEAPYDVVGEIGGAGSGGTGTTGNDEYNAKTRTIHEETDSVGQRINTEEGTVHTDTKSSQAYTDREVTQGYSDREIRATFTDTVASQSYTDTEQDSAHTDNDTIGSRSDSGSSARTGSRLLSLTRSGNIGVTTTQQMLQSERDVAQINLYEVVARDILKQIAVLVYGE